MAKGNLLGVIQTVSVVPDKRFRRAVKIVVKPDRESPLTYVYPKDEGRQPDRITVHR